MLIYLDSVIIIYQYDDAGQFHRKAIDRLTALFAAGDRVAVSDLVRFECRIGPLLKGDMADLARFDGFFARPDISTIPITSTIFDRANDIRARHRFKPFDSLHLAAAIEGGCDAFLTNDLHLARFPGIAVEALP